MLQCKTGATHSHAIVYIRGNKPSFSKTSKDVPMAFRSVSNFFDQIGQAQRMSADYNRMRQMSPESLSRMGVERNDIANHLYNKYFGGR
jgi:hypothetical protein